MAPSEFWAWPVEDQQYAVGLLEFEASLNSLGFPRDEATSKDADPNDRHRKYEYVAESVIDWSLQAEVEHYKSIGDDDAFARSRVVRVRRVDR